MGSKFRAICSGERIVNIALEFVTSARLYAWERILEVRLNLGGQVHTGEVGGVRVHSIKIRRTFNQGPLLLAKFRETISKHLLHMIGVEAEIHRISVPSNGKVKGLLGSDDVCQVI